MHTNGRIINHRIQKQKYGQTICKTKKNKTKRVNQNIGTCKYEMKNMKTHISKINNKTKKNQNRITGIHTQ